MEVGLAYSSTGHEAAIYAIASDDAAVYTGDGNGWLVRWPFSDPSKGKLLAKLEDRIFSLYIEEETIWMGTMTGLLLLLNRTDGSIRKILAHQKGIFGIYKWEGYLITVGGDGILKYWSPEANLVKNLPVSAASLRCLAIHPKLDIGLIGSSDAAIYEVNLRQSKVLQQISNAHQPSVFSIDWISESAFASGGRDAKLRKWDYERANEQYQNVFDAHWYTVNAIASHPTADLLATGSRDRSIKIWEKSTFALLKVIDSTKFGTPNGSVNRLQWKNDYLISVGDDRKVNWWKLQTDLGEAKTDDNLL